MADRREPLSEIVRRALAEDVGAGDVTTAGDGAGRGAARAPGSCRNRPGVVFGLDLVAETMRQCGVEHVDKLVVEGAVARGRPGRGAVGDGAGGGAARRRAHRAQLPRPPLRDRDADRPLRRGGGRAPDARILDTRKTTPGLRVLEKAAVAAGGGRNHRLGLHDAILIKENHIALAGGVAKAVYAARKAQPELPVEVEVRNLDETAYALGTGADRLLLDNMDLETLRGAVELRDQNSGDGARPGPRGLRRRRPGDGPRRSPRPASTSSRSAPSPTPPRRSTSASCSSLPSRLYLSSLERRRSLRTRPPVCSCGQ